MYSLLYKYLIDYLSIFVRHCFCLNAERGDDSEESYEPIIRGKYNTIPT